MATKGYHGFLGQLQTDVTAVFTVLLYRSIVCAHARIHKTRSGLLGSTAAILHFDVVSLVVQQTNDGEQRNAVWQLRSATAVTETQ